jgi:hypothetical protein
MGHDPLVALVHVHLRDVETFDNLADVTDHVPSGRPLPLPRPARGPARELYGV